MKKRFEPYEPVHTYFRVWPHDIDVNIHLTAARYLSFADFGRVSWLAANGLLKRFYATGYQAVLNAQEITYIREFRPFSRVDVVVQLKCWDEKYGYFEQKFYHKGELYAVSHARMAMLYKKKVVSYGEAFKHFGTRCRKSARNRGDLGLEKKHYAPNEHTSQNHEFLPIF